MQIFVSTALFLSTTVLFFRLILLPIIDRNYSLGLEKLIINYMERNPENLNRINSEMAFSNKVEIKSSKDISEAYYKKKEIIFF